MVTNIDDSAPQGMTSKIDGQTVDHEFKRFGRAGLFGDDYDVYYTVRISIPAGGGLVELEWSAPKTLWGTISGGNYITANWLTWWSSGVLIDGLDIKWNMPEGHTPATASVSTGYGTAVVNASGVAGVRSTVTAQRTGGVLSRRPFTITIQPGFINNGDPPEKYSFSLFLASTIIPLVFFCCCCFCVRRALQNRNCFGSGRGENNRERERRHI